MKIGIDLDNTLIFYDDAFVTSAKERGLAPENFTGTKQQVRDHIRTLPKGETEWQKLQGYVYGRGISHASIFPGAAEFIARAIKDGHELFIISHKTEFGHFDESRTSLREAALGLLETQGFFQSGFQRANVSFHDTRASKVDKLSSLALDWFIDDLIEVYEEPHFPREIRKILFHTATSPAPAGEWRAAQNWQEITKIIFP